ncbi:uncharacterized protein K489DRAFT_255960 [Dissoconium aciculare CBS 342.82]|uniref:Uncharacterized protein n=1 Tax=Dissoconium aciculare CBS 342.82 TaxID=1314786 RepID=A0A6J3M2N7_9PEZI|nr:uncharacterized protein K489DRAFT_255960 [Dissoconium aciculare CBS 342.82]KAF1821764.1 hypothetical protein K489DRAFT_255960 [Dissoconium aciculare CBS 342.82]
MFSGQISQLALSSLSTLSLSLSLSLVFLSFSCFSLSRVDGEGIWNLEYGNGTFFSLLRVLSSGFLHFLLWVNRSSQWVTRFLRWCLL